MKRMLREAIKLYDLGKEFTRRSPLRRYQHLDICLGSMIEWPSEEDRLVMITAKVRLQGILMSYGCAFYGGNAINILFA